MPEDDRGRSPGAARRELGALLKRLREAAGMRLGDAAAHVQRSTATMSRLENGKLVPRLVEVTALLDLYGRRASIAAEVRERALVLAGDSRKQEWFSPFRDVITGNLTQDHIQRLVEFETDAEEILSYAVEFVPGLLQTAGYARAVADVFYPDSTGHERSRFVEFRLARQFRLVDGALAPLGLRAVIRQTALRRKLGSAAVMTEQLHRLAVELRNGLPTVQIRVVPDELAIREAMGGPFTVMQFPGDGNGGLVYLEGGQGADYVQNEETVTRYRRDFWSLWEASLPRSSSLAVVDEILRSLS